MVKLLSVQEKILVHLPFEAQDAKQKCGENAESRDAKENVVDNVQGSSIWNNKQNARGYIMKHDRKSN